MTRKLFRRWTSRFSRPKKLNSTKHGLRPRLDVLENRLTPSAGTLDPAFGTGGTVITDFATSRDVGEALVVQPDGKIVVVGTTESGGGGDNFALARYNADGTPDNSFSFNGKVVTDFAGGQDSAFAVALQNDGKIVAAGTAMLGVSLDFALARYNADGTLDESFGTHGKVTTDFASSSDAALSVAVQADGKIVLVGSTSTFGPSSVFDFALARYNPNGALDSSFSADGKVTTDFSGVEDTARAVATQADGKIVVVGGIRNPATVVLDFALARYNADGALDSSFGSGGKVTTDFGGGVDSSSSVAIQADGRIVALGSRFTTSSADFAIARYHTDGALDSNFDADGKVTTDFGGGTDSGSSVVIQADGKILAVGSTRISGGDSEFALARYRPDGTLDPSFSADGKVTTDLGAEDTARAVAIQSDGKIVVAGAKEVSSGLRDFALARYLGDPVQSIVINDGATQRSMVTRLTVAFSTVVTLDSGAFELIRERGGPVSLTVASSVVGFQTVAVLTFSGPDILGGSLADGNYTLRIHGDLTRDSQGHAIDADADGTAGGDRVVSFHRLFGDTDGDRDVDRADQDVFRRTFHSQVGDAAYLWFLDFDGDGIVGAVDHREFNRRRNTVLNP